MAELAYAGARIMVVDDEQTNLVLLNRMLRRAGYTQITTVEDSRTVMRLVEEQQPDLILLDLMMPHVDGYTLLAQLTAEANPGDYLPILVLTADATPQAWQRALSGGAKDFLTKPFDQKELLLRVGNLLETRFLYLRLQQQLANLESVNEQTNQAITFRDQALSAISHDFGQPLAAIRLTTETLEGSDQGEPAKDRKAFAADLKRIEMATSQMAAMISEMSDLARLHMGRGLVLRLQEMDLVALAREQVASLPKTGKRHRVRVECSESTLTGRWDRARLSRVLSNLLNNAVKFSPTGGEITVSIAAEGESAVLAVSDPGVGIPEADLPHVFDSFFRATNVKRIEGTGVGLASARQIVESHGGSIEVDSAVGTGTTVRIRLPRR